MSMTTTASNPLSKVAALDAEIAQTQRDDQIAREGLVPVDTPQGAEVLMDREALDARIAFLRRIYNSYNKTMVAELKRLIAEQARRDLYALGYH